MIETKSPLLEDEIKQINGKIIRCVECSKEFYVAQWQLKRNSRFCSKKCRYESKEVGLKISIAKLGGTRPPITEETREKLRKNAKEKGFGKWMKGKKLSEETRQKISKNSARIWLGKLIRTSFEYKLWRKGVFLKDKYTCILCGDNQGGNLEADHYPIPFSAILNKLIVEQGLENLYNKALKYEMFWILDNGRTLCRECHKKTDTYGEKAKKYKLQ